MAVTSGIDGTLFLGTEGSEVEIVGINRWNLARNRAKSTYVNNATGGLALPLGGAKSYEGSADFHCDGVLPTGILEGVTGQIQLAGAGAGGTPTNGYEGDVEIFDVELETTVSEEAITGSFNFHFTEAPVAL